MRDLFFQIINCFLKAFRRIFEVAQTAIAKLAKQPANFSGFMAMVNCKRMFRSMRRLANKANAALPLKHFFKLFGRYAVKPFSRPNAILFFSGCQIRLPILFFVFRLLISFPARFINATFTLIMEAGRFEFAFGKLFFRFGFFASGTFSHLHNKQRIPAIFQFVRA